MEISKKKDEIMKLIAEKEVMENELGGLYSILSKSGVGMTEPLVDAEDYPRSDIDVYEIRATRQKIICLQNDLKRRLCEIEDKIHSLHAFANENPAISKPQQHVYVQPVARVAWVAACSPAAVAGLHAGDEIVEFGSLNISNFRTISDFTVVVKNSVGRKINVKIKRNDILLNVHVTPSSWSIGGGLLGCKIVELIEDMD